MLNKFDNRFGLTWLSRRGKENGGTGKWIELASDKSTTPKESSSVAKIRRREKEKKVGEEEEEEER